MLPVERWFGSALRCGINWRSSDASERAARVFALSNFWVFVSWWWPAWRDALVVIQPETVLRWRRRGIALIWKYRSHRRWRGGRPRIAVETRQLIHEMARANFLWGAPRIPR